MEHKNNYILWTGLALASTVLAIAPLKWLLQSWHDPAYQSYGALYCLVIAALVFLSLRSSPAQHAAMPGRVIVLFVGAAAIRFAGQYLAINVLSALALSIDVFAIATVLRLDQRRIALSPFWLAIFFLFALPLGPILQRVAGFPLQMISAELACSMLQPFFTDLVCQGVRLQVSGVDVLVDLPCSGSAGLLLMISLWAVLNVMYRPTLWHATIGGLAVVLASLLGNGLRIALLASGLALGVDTMEPTLHAMIGLTTLALSAGVFVLLYQPTPEKPKSGSPRMRHLPSVLHLPLVIAALALALVIVATPKTPLDVSHPMQMSALPGQLLGHRARLLDLAPVEAAYFTTYGGTAQKAQFGPLGLNVVQTSSPLRHLHSPATCLLGMGYKVQFLGTRFEPIPTSIYQASAPDGQVWHVAVSFISEQGHQTASVGEAVWTWLNGTSRGWRAIQRITPVSLPTIERMAFENATLAALDL